MGLGYGETVTHPSNQGGIVAIYYLGTTVGTLLGGAISDRIGRIRTVLIGCFFAIFGAALQVGIILPTLTYLSRQKGERLATLC